MSEDKDIIENTENEDVEQTPAQEAEAQNDTPAEDALEGSEESADIEAPEKEESDDGKWYVVHTYSGYENKVKVNLEKSIENQGLEDLIYEIKVPMEEIVEVRNGQKKLRQSKVFPGYVMVKMVMTDKSWYIVRNTRGVTGFVGPGSKPIPLTDEEVVTMGMERIPIKREFEVGDHVRVTNGALENFIGVVQEVHMDQQRVKISVSMFGRDTPVELEFYQVKKI
jgi:transcriptional antiterminator NusG